MAPPLSRYGLQRAILTQYRAWTPEEPYVVWSLDEETGEGVATRVHLGWNEFVNLLDKAGVIK